jgi:hypothetical protein
MSSRCIHDHYLKRPTAQPVVFFIISNSIYLIILSVIAMYDSREGR